MHLGSGTVFLTIIAFSFWSRALKSASKCAATRFVRDYETYVAAVIQQAEDRDRNYVRTIEEYYELRRNTIGAKPSFDLLLLPLEIPEEILEDPRIATLAELSIDMIILGNVCLP